MEQKIKLTAIQLKKQEVITFHKVISYTKFGYNAVFVSNPREGCESDWV